MYEHQAQDQRCLLHAMDAVCENTTGDQCTVGNGRHARCFFPCCIVRENICCDVKVLAVKLQLYYVSFLFMCLSALSFPLLEVTQQALLPKEAAILQHLQETAVDVLSVVYVVVC